MAKYMAETVRKDGFSLMVLKDIKNDGVAEIMIEKGNNLIRFESKGYPVIVPPSDLNIFNEDMFSSFKYGTPILFPPNRIKQGQFTFQERLYSLPINEPPNHHLHGEMCSKAWEMVDFGASDAGGAFVTSRFRYADHPEMIDYFPHRLTFTLTHRLLDGCLQLYGTVVNEGEDDAPFAFGLHPYFSLPFENSENIMLQVPATAEWPVTNEAFVTGKPSVTPFSQGLTEGLNIVDYPQLGCSLLTVDEGDRTCRITMTNHGYTIAYQLDLNFPFLVLFRPDWASAFSLEPYSYVTDAFNLPYEYERTGAKGIRAGEEVTFNTNLWIEST